MKARMAYGLIVLVFGVASLFLATVIVAAVADLGRAGVGVVVREMVKPECLR